MATFSDEGSIDCIFQDIISAKPEKNPSSFGCSLNDIWGLLFSKVNESPEIREIKF